MTLIKDQLFYVNNENAWQNVMMNGIKDKLYKVQFEWILIIKIASYCISATQMYLDTSCQIAM